jgi:hypothetical protein
MKSQKRTQKNWLFLALALMLVATPILTMTLYPQQAQAFRKMM